MYRAFDNFMFRRNFQKLKLFFALRTIFGQTKFFLNFIYMNLKTRMSLSNFLSDTPYLTFCLCCPKYVITIQDQTQYYFFHPSLNSVYIVLVTVLVLKVVRTHVLAMPAAIGPKARKQAF